MSISNTSTYVATTLRAVLIALAASVAACDSIQPDLSDQLVVEGFFDAGQPSPTITVRKTVGLSASRDEVRASLVTDAELLVEVNGANIPYRVSAERPGQYLPEAGTAPILRAGDLFSVEARWQGEVATGTGRVPPMIRLDSMILDIPRLPVEAVLVDSLRLDSLGIDAETGFLYPVEATLWWQSQEDVSEDFWVQAQLKPFTSFSSVVVDFFLLPEQVFPEADAGLDAARRRWWTGLYAVPVPAAESPLPAHSLRLALVRSGADYADYARTRSSPDRREPTSNLKGALGILAGVSVDSLVVSIDEAYAGKRTVVRATGGR